MLGVFAEFETNLRRERRGPARGGLPPALAAKRSVHPEDIAEAVLFFASETSAKSTGNILNVDAGNQIAFSR
jgi:NAD(P)-dependent dehydrogenase (short-subunit alcohol dehydrogenase family)